MAGDRCERTDLPVGQCGDTCCRPDLAADVEPERQVVARFPARYPGTCCACTEPIKQDTYIARTSDGEYAHDDCSRSWPDAPWNPWSNR